MEDGPIRSRRPIRSVQTANYSPPHGSPGSPGSPRRRNDRHLSPNLSGSDIDDEVEPNVLDHWPDTTASTMNSSADVADGESIKYKFSQVNLKYYPDGNLQEVSKTRMEKAIINPEKKESSNHVLWVLAVVIIFGLLAVYFVMYHGQVNGHVHPAEQRCSFDVCELKFPNQDRVLWKSLEYGVENVLNKIPTSPSIFLLAYHDMNSANRITRCVVKRTTECMKSKGNALELSPADLESTEMKSDYGVVITKYQNQLKKSGVMLVNDLNKVPKEVAPAFHSFCDVHNPLVDRSIIFLTLQLTQIHSSSYTTALSLVENYLRSNWSGVDSYVLDPLIIRVTDQVFVLKKE